MTRLGQMRGGGAGRSPARRANLEAIFALIAVSLAVLAATRSNAATTTTVTTRTVYATGKIVPIPASIPHEEGDMVDISIPDRTLTLDVPADVLDARKIAQEKRDRPYTPVHRERTVSAALRAYASMATSASDGAYRRVPD